MLQFLLIKSWFSLSIVYQLFFPPLELAPWRLKEYPYTRALEALESFRPPSAPLGGSAHGFLPLEEWVPYLASMPDRALAEFLRRGMSQGFRVGFDCSLPLQAARGNLASVEENLSAVKDYLDGELREVTIRSASPGETIHISPIGLIPKGGQPGKFRLIVDLSSPRGASVNDGIDPELCSLSYSSVDEAVRRVQQSGPWALMAKLDLKLAYQRAPVHPDDQPLLGMSWEGRTFCDRALPFGLRSALKLFTAVVDGLSWALQCEGIVNLIHYLDDFFFWSEEGSPNCARALSTAVPLCHRLGLPVAPQKVVGPSTSSSTLPDRRSDSLRRSWSSSDRSFGPGATGGLPLRGNSSP